MTGDDGVTQGSFRSSGSSSDATSIRGDRHPLGMIAAGPRVAATFEWIGPARDDGAPRKWRIRVPRDVFESHRVVGRRRGRGTGGASPDKRP